MVEKNIAFEAVTSDSETGQFSPQKIYIKGVTFESSDSPDIFNEKWEPAVDVNLNSTAKPMENHLYEVVLSVTVTVTIKERMAYLIKTHQAGIFRINGFSDKIVNRMISTICPNILFPFARESVADLISRGGFPQLLLAPVNFELLYQHQQNVAGSTKLKTKH